MLSDIETTPNDLINWGRKRIAAIFLMTFSNEFPWIKTYKSRLKFHWILFPRFQYNGTRFRPMRRDGNCVSPYSRNIGHVEKQLNNIPALVTIMAWRRPRIVRLPTPMCVIRPQWVNRVNSISSTGCLGHWTAPSAGPHKVLTMGRVT